MDATRLDAQRRIDTLEWIPQPMRTRMDEAGVRISLADWQALGLARRAVLAGAARQHLAASVFVSLLRTALGREPARIERACKPGPRGLDSHQAQIREQ
ncbi:MAG TPA: nitrate reductase associated protein [Ramlibacter sp.]|nr:nitrate reductase associated protein [Ramlibacter sp.]